MNRKPGKKKGEVADIFRLPRMHYTDNLRKLLLTFNEYRSSTKEGGYEYILVCSPGVSLPPDR